MPYLMRKLILDELRLRETFRIIRKFLDFFDEGEANMPNFSHWHDSNETSIRLRVDYRDDTVVGKAVGVLNQLVADHDIIRYEPIDWVPKDDETIVTRSACNLAFQCASVMSDLAEFEHIRQNNVVHQKFPYCFFSELFNQIGINLKFNLVDVQHNKIGNNIQNIVDNSLEAVSSDIVLDRNDFFDSHFFERFVHLLCDNLIVHPNGEKTFWGLFYLKNGPNYFSFEECRRRFCEELS